MRMRWRDLLFAHWPVDADRVRSCVPPDFELDLFDGQAWIGIVPFRMTNVVPRGIPPLPWVSAFPELNVRTYVRVGDRPGVYFFSLDAGNPLAVRTARALLNLPYYTASMRMTTRAIAVEYESRRTGKNVEAALAVAYEPTGPPFAAAPGSLEHFLTERYCLYNINHRGGAYRLDIHHPPWPLQPAQARFARNSMADPMGLVLPDRAPLLHFAKRQDTIAWAPARLA